MNVLYSIIQHLYFMGIYFQAAWKFADMFKNYSLLLSGLGQRLLLAAVMLAIVWGVHAWAVHKPTEPTSSSSQVEAKPWVLLLKI